MLYQIYQAYSDLTTPLRAMARLTSAMLGATPMGSIDGSLTRGFAAANELIARSGLRHRRPSFAIERVEVDGRQVEVREDVALETPFATLLHFKKLDEISGPPVLLVAPMSGHFATLLRGTVETMLADHDVYITDWHNARDVSAEHGKFGVDEFIDHIIRFIEAIGPETHVVAVCQPCAPVLAAVAVMAESGNAAQPRSLTLMAGPVDARSNPTKVNELAMSHPIEWFERLISPVPWGFPGATRPVYPGFLQLTAFLSMNAERHAKAHRDLFDSIVSGDDVKAEAIRTFYDEYFAVCDLPGEFFLETVRTIFQQHALPLGRFEWRGQVVQPRAIRRTALLTVEGERDDICGIGQTLAAQDLCTGLRPYMKRHHLQAGVGHYGVFNGRRWAGQIYPVLKNVILANS
jgi:poly(3-hydroxybutyrate) depolymerase